MTTFNVTLPTPPSYHQCQGKSRHGGYKTKKYIAWLNECQFKLIYASVKFEKPVTIWLNVNGGRITSDIDNYIKQFLDLLVIQGILIDDNKKYVKSIHAEWDETKERKNTTELSVWDHVE